MNYKKKIPNLSRIFNQLSHKIIINNLDFYQNSGCNDNGSRKETDVRVKVIKKKLISDNIKNLIDLGSAEGKFLKLASSLGIFALGVEADERRYLVSNYNKNFEDYKNFGVIFNELSLKFLKNIPQIDSAIYLSVHHHILASSGIKMGNEILKELFKKVKKSLFFETAMHDEFSDKWSLNYKKNLKNMNDASIRKFFKVLGAKKIQILANTKAYNEGYIRPLYYIKK